jgi:hypothetical protein
MLASATSKAAMPKPRLTQSPGVPPRLKKCTSSAAIAATASGVPTVTVVRSGGRDLRAAINSRTTRSSPDTRHRSRATVAAWKATGTVTTGRQATSSARLRARKLKQALSAATALFLRETRTRFSAPAAAVPVPARAAPGTELGLIP